MSSKVIFVIMIVYSSFYAMQESGPSLVQCEYVKALFRAHLDVTVRAFMTRSPDDQHVKFINKYLTLAAENYWKTRQNIKELPKQLTQQDLNSFACQSNLFKIFEVRTISDLKIKLGQMGIAYDFFKPCNTWEQILTNVQEQIKNKCKCQLTTFNWHLKSLEIKS